MGFYFLSCTFFNVAKFSCGLCENLCGLCVK
jgi:hypothetical protein